MRFISTLLSGVGLACLVFAVVYLVTHEENSTPETETNAPTAAGHSSSYGANVDPVTVGPARTIFGNRPQLALAPSPQLPAIIEKSAAYQAVIGTVEMAAKQDQLRLKKAEGVANGSIGASNESVSEPQNTVAAKRDTAGVEVNRVAIIDAGVTPGAEDRIRALLVPESVKQKILDNYHRTGVLPSIIDEKGN